MPVKYVLVERANPANRTAPKKFYAQHKSAGEVTLRQLKNEISARSTVSAADTAAVLESLLEILPEKLSQGLIVRLGEFGSFSGTLSSSGAATAATFTGSLITRFAILFRPGKELNKAIAVVDFQKEASNS